MFNMIKMDMYRMFRMKSLYIIWFVLAASILFSTYWSREMTQYANDMLQETAGDTGEEDVMLGMQVMLPTQPGEEVTLFDQVYSNLQGKFVALFLLIFTVLYSTADISSGYIKNFVPASVKMNSGWKAFLKSLTGEKCLRFKNFSHIFAFIS